MTHRIKASSNSKNFLKKFINKIMQPLKYWSLQGYQAEQYWTDRHIQNQFNLCGVGNITLSHEENEKMYAQAQKLFLSLCHDQKINFTHSKILDIGCGTGFYTKVFIQNGATKYLGIDITDVLFDKLKQEFPNFKFQKLDISTEKLHETFDLIIMIDVTQHITNEDKFSFAMQNIKTSLNENGVFIVTSWLDDNLRHKFYEVSRSVQKYQKEFPEFIFSEPIPFRDKFIFSIKKTN